MFIGNTNFVWKGPLRIHHPDSSPDVNIFPFPVGLFTDSAISCYFGSDDPWLVRITLGFLSMLLLEGWIGGIIAGTWAGGKQPQSRWLRSSGPLFPRSVVWCEGATAPAINGPFSSKRKQPVKTRLCPSWNSCCVPVSLSPCPVTSVSAAGIIAAKPDDLIRDAAQ